MPKFDLLYQSGKNIFTTSDMRLLWHESNPDHLKSQLKYYVDQKRLYRLKKGVYSLSPEYDPFELAQKLIQPSYISLHSALVFHGINFQATQEVTSMALYWRSFNIKKTAYLFHKLQENIFFNPLGIIHEKNYWIASKERAIADTLYLKGETAFDNLNSLNKDLLVQMVDIYSQKSTAQHLQKLIKSL